MAKKKTRSHGGARTGAGRPVDPNAKLPIPFRATPRLHRFLDEYANRTEAIELLLRNSPEFKRWDKTTPKENQSS